MKKARKTKTVKYRMWDRLKSTRTKPSWLDWSTFDLTITRIPINVKSYRREYLGEFIADDDETD